MESVVNQCQTSGFGACKEAYNSAGAVITCGTPSYGGSAICEHSKLINNFISISNLGGGLILAAVNACASQLESASKPIIIMALQ